MRLVDRIQTLEDTIRTGLQRTHPIEPIGDAARELEDRILELEERTTQLSIPCQYARRAIRLWAGTRALYSAIRRVGNADGAWELEVAMDELRWATNSYRGCTDRFTETTCTYEEALRIINALTK
jgi:hypothetical protein